jgi:hypothetical protein
LATTVRGGLPSVSKIGRSEGVKTRSTTESPTPPTPSAIPTSLGANATLDMEMPCAFEATDPPGWEAVIAEFKEFKTELLATKVMQKYIVNLLTGMQRAMDVLSLTQVMQTDELAFCKSRVVALEEDKKKEGVALSTIQDEVQSLRLLALEREVSKGTEGEDVSQAKTYGEVLRPRASRVYNNPVAASTSWPPVREEHCRSPQQNEKYRCTTLVVHAVVKEGLQREEIIKTISQLTDTPTSDIKIGDITPTLHRIYLPSSATTLRILMGRHDLAMAGVKVKEDLSGAQRHTKKNRQATFTSLYEKGERLHWRGERIFRDVRVRPCPNIRGPYDHKP